MSYNISWDVEECGPQRAALTIALSFLQCQLDDYHRRLGEWSERPHIQVFMVLYHHYLCKGNVKINEETLDTMEVPLFYGPLVS